MVLVLAGFRRTTPEAEAAGLTRKDFRDAIERLLAREVIENVTSKDSKGKHDGRYHLHLKQPATMEED